MVEYMGIYNQIVNSVTNNQDAWMRKEAMTRLIVEYDKLWRPFTEKLLPKETAPSDDGTVPNVDTAFRIPITADPGEMSPHGDYLEMSPSSRMAFTKERMHGKMLIQRGPTWNPLEFKDNFKNGYLDKRNQILATNSIKAMARAKEYWCTKYLYATAPVMNEYGNQYGMTKNRLMRIDCDAANSGMAGIQWSEVATATPHKDIVSINSRLGEFGGNRLKKLFIGPRTQENLEKNTTIENGLKYIFDTIHNSIATSLKGVIIETVLGQTYKQFDSSASRIGAPGDGDIRYDIRDGDSLPTRRKKMMVDSNGEFAIGVSDGDIGFTYTLKTHPDQQNTNSPYVNEWIEPRWKFKFSEMYQGYCPYVANFDNYMILHNING